MLFINISFPCTFPNSLGLKTKDEPKRNQGTTKELPITQKCFLLRFAISFISLIPCLIPPTDDRENSDTTP